jgi:hypothetical protein
MSSEVDNSEIHFLIYTLELTGQLTQEQLDSLKSAADLVSPESVTGSVDEKRALPPLISYRL